MPTNRIRATDTSAVPAQQRSPRSLSNKTRALLVVYGVCLLLTFAGLFWLALEDRQQNAERDAAIVRELNRRTADRQAQNEAIRTALCGVLTVDLAGSANARELARQFDCP